MTLEEIDQALALNPHDAALRRARGAALLAADRTPEALREAEALLQRDPRDIEALLLGAEAGRRGGSVGDARMLVAAALQIDDHHEGALRGFLAVGGDYARQPRPLAEIEWQKDFFWNAVALRDVPRRTPFFVERFAGLKLLHVGCVDHPVFDPRTNLHILLSRFTRELHGCDTAVEGFDALRRYVDAPLLPSLAAVVASGERYDAVLASEVIEHTPNPNAFLTELFAVPAREFLITAPHFKHYVQSQLLGSTLVEFVHPDHKCWYSPYTLLNTVRPFIGPDDKVEVFLLENQTAVGVAVHRAGPPA